MEGPSRPRAPTLDVVHSARNHVLGAPQRPLRSGRLGPWSAQGRRRSQGRLPAPQPLKLRSDVGSCLRLSAAARFPSPHSAPPGCLSVGGQRQPRRGALPFKTRVPEVVPRQRRYRKWMRRQLRAAGRESSSRCRAGVAVAAGGAAQARAGRVRPRGCPWGAGGRAGDAGRPWTPLRSRCRR